MIYLRLRRFIKDFRHHFTAKFHPLQTGPSKPLPSPQEKNKFVFSCHFFHIEKVFNQTPKVLQKMFAESIEK
jgi:hypothetical protein